MARHMAADNAELFRAVVDVTYSDTRPEEGAEPEVRSFTHVLGPYQTKAAATQAIKRADREAQWYKHYYDKATVVGRVERATVTWEPVE